MNPLGSRYVRKDDRHIVEIVAVDPTSGQYVASDLTAFSSPYLLPVDVLRREYKAATDAAPPLSKDAQAALDAEQRGWDALSANQKFQSTVLAVTDGTVEPGDTDDRGNVLTDEQVARHKSLRDRLSRSKAKSPEQIFAEGQADQIKAAADKILGSPDLLASYETGQLEVSEHVEKVVDRAIRERQRREDRSKYTNAHVFHRETT